MFTVYGLTYDHTINYGSCMQAYALGAAIRSLKPGGEDCDYSLIPIRTFPEWQSRSLLSTLLSPLIRFSRKQFEPFEKEYIRFTPVHSMQGLTKLNDTADAFVCGSDVIWNPDFNHGSNVCALDFAEKYKFSYAASFGKANIPPAVLERMRPALLALNDISVREVSGEKVVADCCGRTAQTVADPVLLLKPEDWRGIAAPAMRRKKPYIFVYVTQLTDEIRAFIKALKTKTGYGVIYAAYGPRQQLSEGILRVQTPQLWLRQLMDADLVVTNSFHSTAFSVLFHKNFYTVVSGEKAGGINVRMYDFLTAMALPERIVNRVPDVIDVEAPSFDRADKTIAALRENSLEYLRRNLEAAYREKNAGNTGD